MGRIDLTPVVWFAIFDIVVAGLTACIGGAWLGYHLVSAVIAYFGS